MKNIIDILLDKNTGKVFFNEGDGDPDADKLKKQLEDALAEAERYKGEFEDAKTRRTSALSRAQNAEKQLDELKSSIEGMPSSDEYNQMKKDYDDLKKELEKIKEEEERKRIEAIEDEKEREKAKMKKELEKQQVSFEKKMAELEKKIEEGSADKEAFQKKLDRFRVRSLEAEIIEAAHEKAFNPKQIVKLIKGDFTFDDEEDSWVFEARNNKGKITDYMTVKERVEAFLEDPDNENLLKADATPGSHSRRSKSRKSGSGDLLEEAPTDEMYKWSRMNDYGVDKNSSVEEKAQLVRVYKGLHKAKYGKKEEK